MKNYEELMKEIKKDVKELHSCLGAEKGYTEDEIEGMANAVLLDKLLSRDAIQILGVEINIGKNMIDANIGGSPLINETFKDIFGDEYLKLKGEFLKEQDKICQKFATNLSEMVYKKLNVVYDTNKRFEKIVFDPDGCFTNDEEEK